MLSNMVLKSQFPRLDSGHHIHLTRGEVIIQKPFAGLLKLALLEA